MGTEDICTDCAEPQPRVSLDGVPLCDRCSNRRMAAIVGIPDVGDAPSPEVFTSADGRRHRMRFRFRVIGGAGMVAEAEEMGMPPGRGYHAEVMSDGHPADTEELIAALRDEVRRQMLTTNLGHCDLHGHPIVAGDEVEGRLVWAGEGNGRGGPYDVVIDGRVLSWEEFGRALEAYEGWRFRLLIEDSIIPVKD